MHFLVAFAPKIHVQLEFLLVSKIDLASASRAQCLALPLSVQMLYLRRPLCGIGQVEARDVLA